MFWVKKIVSQLIMPIPLSLMLLLITMLLWRSQKRMLLRVAKCCLFSAILLIGLLSQSQISNGLASFLESQYSVNHQNVDGQCVVMVLGSSHNENSALTAVQQLSEPALGRLIEGIRQLKLGKNCQLIVSGWAGDSALIPHAELMRKAAQELGIAPNKITTFPTPKDTVEEAYMLQALIGDTPFKLVTSATHMPRSMYIFNSLGMKPMAAPSDFIARKTYWWRLAAENLLTSQRSIHEYVGLLWLHIRGVSANDLPMPQAKGQPSKMQASIESNIIH